MGYSLVYMTAPDRASALVIARRLVEERLVACANVLDGATSVYHWDGAVQEEGEAVMIAKTRAALIKTVSARIRELHAYQCPCVVVLPITGGNPAFLDWIEAETKPGMA